MHEGVRWILGWLLVLFIVWLALGGPNNDNEGLFTRIDVGGGSLYESEDLDRNNDGIVDDKEVIAGEIRKIEREIKEVEEGLKKLEEQANNSPYRDLVELERATATTDDPEREYLRIEIDRDLSGTLSMAGWYLESSVTGRRENIPKVTKLPISGQPAATETLRVAAGDTVIVNTGRSPIGYSFQLNSCTGYFEAHQDFNPRLPQQCPNPYNDPGVDFGPRGFGDACLDYIERWSHCKPHIEQPPYGFNSQCRAFLTSRLNYNGCVAAHKNDIDFYKNEWRVYLNKEREDLWKAKRELITLRDENGKIVSVLNY